MATRVIFELRGPNDTINITPNIDYKVFQIESLSIPHIWNYLPADTVEWVDSLGVVTSLPTIAESPSIVMLSQLATALTTFDTGGAVYTFTLSSVNMTWALTATANFSLNFGAIMAQHLGITNLVSPGRYGIVNSNALNAGHFFMGTQMIFMRTNLSILGNGTSYDNVTGALEDRKQTTFNSNIVLNLPVKSQIGELETWVMEDKAVKYPLASGLQSMRITLTDEYGVPIDVSPQRMYLTITYKAC